jgi:hypothetical protein
LHSRGLWLAIQAFTASFAEITNASEKLLKTDLLSEEPWFNDSRPWKASKTAGARAK